MSGGGLPGLFAALRVAGSFGFLALVKPANRITGPWYNIQIRQMFSTTEIYLGADHLGAVWNEEN